MASQLPFTGFARKKIGRRRLTTLMTVYGVSTATGASGRPVSYPRAFEHEWLGIAVLAGLTAGAFQATRGARLLPVEALRRV
jgi:hypothetical protein